MSLTSHSHQVQANSTSKQAALDPQIKQRKSEKTRELILQTTADIVRETGNVSFSMADLARKCNMSKGSLYYYFHDREEVVAEVFTRSIDEFILDMEAAVADAASAQDALHKLCVVFAHAIAGGGPVVLAIMRELASSHHVQLPLIEGPFYRIVHLIEVQLKRAQIEGFVRKNIDIAIASSSICGAFLFACITQNTSKNSIEQITKTVHALIDFVVCGIGTQQAHTASASLDENKQLQQEIEEL